MIRVAYSTVSYTTLRLVRHPSPHVYLPVQVLRLVLGMHPTEGFHQPAVGDCAEHRDQYKEIRSSGIPEEMVVVCYTRRGLVVCVCGSE